MWGATMYRIDGVEDIIRDAIERQSRREPLFPSSHSFVASRSCSNDHDSNPKPQSQIGIESYATTLTQDHLRATELDSDSDASPRGLRLTEPPTSRPDLGQNSNATTIVKFTRSSCSLTCSCACHKVTRFKSPAFMSKIVGSLFLGYSAAPWFSQKCDRTVCRSHSSKFAYTYAFPRWFVDRVVMLTIAHSTLKGPELNVRLVRIRDVHSDIFVAAQGASDEVAVYHISRLLEAGEASVFDVDPDGESALQVQRTLLSIWLCFNNMVYSLP